MKIAVKDREGNIYTNDMSDENKQSIIEIHFSTSYTQVIVQDQIVDDEGSDRFLTKDIIIPIEQDGLGYVIDMMAVKDYEIGEWV